ncbi:hypothetical protein AVL62_12010 [Serinicoccus chungangensis]|uniref:DUF218 domain-containing protein n=1 Tax=Serinicoccus chungangensis TaxID=767452 RepID=A0A0W8IAE8_9MICO|nr:YdcF family protein [Serinicoccus chungangensis]KUG56850.1 hypothetical protein AVL62_12010 [Serinicoccus chungangensis]
MVVLPGVILPGLLLRYSVGRLARGRRDADTRAALVGGLVTVAVPVVGMGLLGYAAGPVVVGLGTGLLLLAAWPGFVMLVLLAVRWRLSRPGSATRCSAVVVLGMPVPHGEVGAELAARLQGGLTLLASVTGRPDETGSGATGDIGAERADVPLVLTGGRGTRGRPAEAVVMQRWVLGVDPQVSVVLEDRATTTVENLVLSTDQLRSRGIPPPYAVVTSAYHAPRTSWRVRQHRLPLRVVGVRAPVDSAAGSYLRELLVVLKEARWAHPVVAALVLGVALLAVLAAR